MKEIYYIVIEGRKYVSTNIMEITAFALFFGVLGCAEVVGETAAEIPYVTRINPNYEYLPLIEIVEHEVQEG